MNTILRSTILAATTLAVASSSISQARAGDREWATAGKILTGAAAATIVASALAPRPAYVQPVDYSSPYVIAPPLVCAAPPPPVYVAAPAPALVAPAPVVMGPAPVVVQPAPVLVAPPVYVRPVYVAPAPIVTIGFGFYRGPFYHHRWHRW